MITTTTGRPNSKVIGTAHTTYAVEFYASSRESALKSGMFRLDVRIISSTDALVGANPSMIAAAHHSFSHIQATDVLAPFQNKLTATIK